MEKHMEVIRQVNELSRTVLEGLEHIKNRINEGYYEDTIQLFTNVVEAFSKMEQSVLSLLPHLPSNHLERLTQTLGESLDYTVSLYEKGEGAKVLEALQFNLLPIYKKWQSELESRLRPFITS